MDNNIFPTQSLYYRQFDTCIKFLNLPFNYVFNYPRMSPDGATIWRSVKTKQSETTYNLAVYTSDTSMVNQIKADEFLYRKIDKINEPVSEVHKTLLYEKDRSVVIRDNLWYNQYKHKLLSWPKGTFSGGSIESDRSAIKWIYDNFDFHDRRLVHIRYFMFRDRESLPIVFCNSEETMMLFKLAHSDLFNIKIETVIQYKELRN